MADEKPIKLKFKDDFKSPTLEIGHGQYNRKFEAKDQPFELTGVSHTEGEGKDARTVYDTTPEEEKAILMATGHFEEVSDEDAKSKTSSPKLASTGKIGGAPATESGQ